LFRDGRTEHPCPSLFRVAGVTVTADLFWRDEIKEPETEKAELGSSKLG